MKHKLNKDAYKSYKIGVDEIQGLKAEMTKALKPVQDSLKNKVYWNDCEFSDAEYKSRDGFIANKHNCGGIQLDLIIPKCEESSFDFVSFGEHDENCGYYENEHSVCTCGEDDGLLDARLKVWLKFEGINPETQKLDFYLIMHGGNMDAPYFRQSENYFETSFQASSVAGIQRAASKHIKKLVKKINGEK